MYIDYQSTSDNLIDGCLLMLQTYKNTIIYTILMYMLHLHASSISNNVVNDSPGLPGVQVLVDAKLDFTSQVEKSYILCMQQGNTYMCFLDIWHSL